MSQSILDLMKHFKIHQDENDFNLILNRFQPLIKKYAKKLYYIEYEDSIQELCLALYEALENVTYLENEYACISYLKNAIYHRFCKLYASSKCEQEKIENQTPYEDLIISSDDSTMKDTLFLYDLHKKLNTLCYPKKEIVILLLKGYSDKDIGKQLNCSRQYINRIKKTIATNNELLEMHEE